VSSLAQRCAHFAVGADPARAPAEVRAAARLHILDTFGCGLAASALGTGAYGRAAMAAAAEPGRATVIGAAAPMAADRAALANGTLCHGLDFDDTHAEAIAHVSAVVLPAALAAAQDAGASGAELVSAYLAGSEIVARVGALAAPSYMTRGFHPTSVCGVFGAAAAAARLYGLDEARTAHALGIAGSLASGLFEYLADGADTKPLHAGWAAHAGVSAAWLARAGASGPATVLEGRFGVLRAFFDRDADDLAAFPADGRWETPRISFKPYPACHFVHSSIDAAAALRVAEGVRAEDIESIELAVPAPAVELVLEPRAAKLAPRTPYDAKFSLPYSVATMLARGEVGVASYTAQAIGDRQVLALAARSEHRPRDFASYPGSMPGAVTLRLKDGRVLERVEPHERGGPDRPLPDGEVLAKFRRNAALAVDAGDAQALEAAVLALDEQGDVSFIGGGR
jgi:2-methylcitrate dehydratase PrpD